MPIESKVKGPQLAEWQILLMKGLISCSFRITASGGDGAAVERDCQRRLAATSKRVEFRIKHPDPGYPDIIVELWDLDGNIYCIFQDANGRKTLRNNAASGACGLVLGNFMVYFEQMYSLAMQPDSPMYPRDWKNRDRMDDRAAARLSSADTLQQAAQEAKKNLGLVVYLFVFGDLIDAYQSRTLSHHKHAKIAIRAHIFLQTWRLYLKKAGYSEARHFISKKAFDIFEILAGPGLSPSPTRPGPRILLSPSPTRPDPSPGFQAGPDPNNTTWFIASEPNEHSFAGLRDAFEDFTLQEAIITIPKLHEKLEADVRARMNVSDLKKQASGYSHTYFTSDDIDFSLLASMPTDVDLSTAYGIAEEEVNCLWSLLSQELNDAPTPGLIPQPCPDPDFEDLYLDEETDAAETAESAAAEELQRVVDSLKHVSTYVSRAGDAELDACVMASVALSMDELARIEDLPESNPERFAEIQKEIAPALATQPVAFVALLQGIAESATKSNANPALEQATLPPSSKPLFDVSCDDLAPLVSLRREHQTREERMGVRTYKASGTYRNPKTGVEKPPTEWQILAQKMQAIIRRDQERGSSQGLTQAVRWRTDSGAAVAPVPIPKTGNAANAELAASWHAKDAMKRRQTIFSKLNSVSRVAEAGIGSTCPLETGSYGFAMVGSEIFLARVITMYSKNGGKAGAHAWVPTCDTIGSLSYIVVQLHQHLYHRQFKFIDRNYAALGTFRFAHLPSNSFLVMLPQDDDSESVREFRDHVELGPHAQKIFQDLWDEREALAKAVASLNMVRRKGKAHISLLDMEEDEELT
ncbi:hypothetical protein B0H11DRAFT_2306121 [Mycena galericulata]|nr:hypothetical protein B0H11DRAFT_2306121 [Mycena galericulata]